MRKNHVLYLSSAASELAASNHPTGPVFEKPVPAPGDRALLYVYRPKLSFGMMQVLAACVDVRDLAGVPNGSWQLVHLSPGAHVLSVFDPQGAVRCCPPALRFDVQCGHTYYAECHLHPADMSATWNLAYARIGCEITLRPAPHALRYMVGLRRSESRASPASG